MTDTNVPLDLVVSGATELLPPDLLVALESRASFTVTVQFADPALQASWEDWLRRSGASLEARSAPTIWNDQAPVWAQAFRRQGGDVYLVVRRGRGTEPDERLRAFMRELTGGEADRSTIQALTRLVVGLEGSWRLRLIHEPGEVNLTALDQLLRRGDPDFVEVYLGLHNSGRKLLERLKEVVAECRRRRII